MLTSRQRYVIVLLLYDLEFEQDLLGFVDRACESILLKRGINLTTEETLDALAALHDSDVDLTTLLPQERHSDAALREFFAALEQSLRAATAKPD